MAARVIQTFGSGVCEALPVQLINDIFYLNERGKRLGYYTVSLCFGIYLPVDDANTLTKQTQELPRRSLPVTCSPVGTAGASSFTFSSLLPVLSSS